MTKMTKKDIFETIMMMTDGKYGVDQIEETMTLEDLGIDSLSQIELVMALEEEAGININDDDSEKYFGWKSTVGDIIGYLESRA